MKLWLVRHGQTLLNAQDRLRGWLNPPLSPLGLEQAAEAAAAVPQGLPLYSSDLLRAVQTSKAIGAAKLTPALRPWNVGLLAGLPTEVVHPKLELYKISNDRIPFGECWSDFTARFEAFTASLREESVLVTHFRNVCYLMGYEAASQTGRVACYEVQQK